MNFISHHQTFEDKFAQREILSLPVQCANHCDSCDWSGELGQLEVCKHQFNISYGAYGAS